MHSGILNCTDVFAVSLVHGNEKHGIRKGDFFSQIPAKFPLFTGIRDEKLTCLRRLKNYIIKFIPMRNKIWLTKNTDD